MDAKRKVGVEGKVLEGRREGRGERSLSKDPFLSSQKSGLWAEQILFLLVWYTGCYYFTGLEKMKINEGS